MVKVQFTLEQGEYNCSSNVPLTSALHGVWVFNATPQRFYPRETGTIAIGYEVGLASEPVWPVAEYLAPAGSRSRGRRARPTHWVHGYQHFGKNAAASFMYRVRDGRSTLYLHKFSEVYNRSP